LAVKKFYLFDWKNPFIFPSLSEIGLEQYPPVENRFIIGRHDPCAR